MPRINVLPKNIADLIAAGEVVERPSSVIKEFVENSIDAGATNIVVEIKNGGKTYIRVTDNGCGIDREDVKKAFISHATSKITNIEDLDAISTLGFRGEALASVCAVSRVELLTATPDSDFGTRYVIEGGEEILLDDAGCPVGTTIIVRDLFYNIPARMKFMKKDSTEAGYVADAIGRIALSKPHISFCFISDEKEIFRTSGDGNIKNAILNIYGIECARALIEVDAEKNGIKVKGVIGKPEISRGNRTRQTLFVNERYIKNHVVSKVVEEAYKNSVMVGKFPFFVLGIYLSPALVDVNVHPAKTEIKFACEKDVYDTVHFAVKNALYSETEEKEINIKAQDDGYGRVVKKPEPTFSQLSMSFSESKKPVLPYTEPIKPFNEKISANVTEKYLEYTIPPKEFSNNECIQIEEVIPVVEICEEEKVPVKIIGQLFNTYIIFEQGESLFLVDQHAAHERILYESK